MIDQYYGLRFGQWTVESRISQRFVDCTCDCGLRKSVDWMSLKRGKTRSCPKCSGIRISASKVRHGCSRRNHHGGQSPEWKSWAAMKFRCSSPTHEQYKDYGGRGIRVCERWINSFENFLSDMGKRPNGTTIERKDTNGNYEPGNCYWATRKEQCRNKRTNVVIEAYGKSQCVAAWCEEMGLNPSRIYANVYYRNLSGEQALLS